MEGNKHGGSVTSPDDLGSGACGLTGKEIYYLSMFAKDVILEPVEDVKALDSRSFAAGFWMCLRMRDTELFDQALGAVRATMEQIKRRKEKYAAGDSGNPSEEEE